MSDAIIVGIVIGSIYSVAALGLVLTYKTSGIFNFAHGAVGAAAAYIFFELHFQKGMPWPFAFFLSTVVFGTLAGVVLERLAVALSRVSVPMRVVATFGLLLAIQGLLYAIFGDVPKLNPDFLPTHLYRIGGATVTTAQLILVAIGVLAAVGLTSYFRWSKYGVRMRAVVDNPDLLDMTGINPVSVRRRAWVIGAIFASASGVLIAPNVGLDASAITLLVVFSFGAAAIGLFRNLWLTYAGGLIVGVSSTVVARYIHNDQYRALPDNLSFFILFAVVVFMGSRFQESGSATRPRAPIAVSHRVEIGAAVFGLAFLVAIPFIASDKIALLLVSLGYVLIFMSLGLLVKLSGQISLCQIGFAAIGASSAAHFSHAGLPWLAAILLAALVAVPVGVFLALPAIRLSGIYLALATLGFGIALSQVFYRQKFMFTPLYYLDMPRPSFAKSDHAYYFVCLGFVALGSLVVVLITHGQLGRLLRGLKDSPVALTTHGANTSVTKIIIFGVSAFLAALGGALIAPVTGNANSIDFNYQVSLLLLPVFLLAGWNTLLSPYIGAFLLLVLPAYLQSSTFVHYQPVLFGVAAIAVVVLSQSSWLEARAGGASAPVASARRRPLTLNQPGRHSSRGRAHSRPLDQPHYTHQPVGVGPTES